VGDPKADLGDAQRQERGRRDQRRVDRDLSRGTQDLIDERCDWVSEEDHDDGSDGTTDPKRLE